MGMDLEGNSWNPDAELGAAKDPGPVYGPTKEWDVIVVNDMGTINAMASPGESQLFCSDRCDSYFLGVIVVFTGILPVCQDEEGLAAVLAHGKNCTSVITPRFSAPSFQRSDMLASRTVKIVAKSIVLTSSTQWQGTPRNTFLLLV